MIYSLDMPGPSSHGRDPCKDYVRECNSIHCCTGVLEGCAAQRQCSLLVPRLTRGVVYKIIALHGR